LLTLFRSATGAVRAEPVIRSTNAVLYPWVEGASETMLSPVPSPAVGDAPGKAASAFWTVWGWTAARLEQ